MGSFLRTKLNRLLRFLMEMLNPNWRWLALILGTWSMLQISNIAAPASSHLLWWQGLATTAWGIAAFTLFWVASRPSQPQWLPRVLRHLPAFLRWHGWGAVILLVLMLNTWSVFTRHAGDLFQGNYHNDAIAYMHEDAQLVLQGINPYTDDQAFWDAAARWPNALATPLFLPNLFGDNPFKYPSAKKIDQILQYERLHPQARGTEFDPITVHNYPAGVIWLMVPFVWAGLHSVVWVNLLMFVGMLWLVLARARREDRALLSMAVILSPVLWDYSLFVNIDIASLFFVLAAWHWFARGRTSAILFGIACAMKQLAWFIAPFYLLEVWRREGWRAALERAVWMSAVFGALNLPYIVTSPIAWFHSMIVPMTDPMFPLGYGPITLSLSGLIPFGASHLWTIVVGAITVALLVYQWKRPTITIDGIFLGLVPLWFSWRSPMNYLVLIPVLVAWVGVQHVAAAQAQQGLTATAAALADDVPEELLALPAPAPELERELAGAR